MKYPKYISVGYGVGEVVEVIKCSYGGPNNVDFEVKLIGHPGTILLCECLRAYKEITEEEYVATLVIES